MKFFPENATEAGLLLGVPGDYYDFDGALEGYQMRVSNQSGASPDLNRGKPNWTEEELTAYDYRDEKIAEEEDLQLELRQRLSRI